MTFREKCAYNRRTTEERCWDGEEYPFSDTREGADGASSCRENGGRSPLSFGKSAPAGAGRSRRRPPLPGRRFSYGKRTEGAVREDAPNSGGTADLVRPEQTKSVPGGFCCVLRLAYRLFGRGQRMVVRERFMQACVPVDRRAAKAICSGGPAVCRMQRRSRAGAHAGSPGLSASHGRNGRPRTSKYTENIRGAPLWQRTGHTVTAFRRL